MKLNIIHGKQSKRLPILYKELSEQEITDFEIWQGVHDSNSVVRSINLSHKQIVQNAKDLGLQKVCIAEDDIMFLHPQGYQYFLENEPQTYDMYLGGIYLGDIRKDYTVEYFTGMHLYIIHELFYDTFLSLPEHEHIDRALSGLGLYKVCNKFVAMQHNGVSSNTGKHEVYDKFLNNRQVFNGY